MTDDITPPGAAATDQQPNERLRILESELAKARHEAAGYRTQNKGELAEFKKQLAEFAGTDPQADTPTIFEKLKQDRDGIRDLKVGKALAEAFHKHGAAKPSLVRAYLSEAGLMSKFDPSAEDFEDHVNDTIAEVLQQNPELRGQNIARTSSAPFPGGQPSRISRADLAGMSPDEVNALRLRGGLDHLLGRS